MCGISFGFKVLKHCLHCGGYDERDRPLTIEEVPATDGFCSHDCEHVFWLGEIARKAMEEYRVYVRSVNERNFEFFRNNHKFDSNRNVVGRR